MLSSLLIRGGQTAAHEVRMAVQVTKTLAWVMALVTLLYAATHVALTLSLYDLYQWFMLQWCALLQEISGDAPSGDPQQTIPFRDRHRRPNDKAMTETARLFEALYGRKARLSWPLSFQDGVSSCDRKS